jgi:hypothetical protein
MPSAYFLHSEHLPIHESGYNERMSGCRTPWPRSWSSSSRFSTLGAGECIHSDELAGIWTDDMTSLAIRITPDRLLAQLLLKLRLPSIPIHHSLMTSDSVMIVPSMHGPLLNSRAVDVAALIAVDGIDGHNEAPFNCLTLHNAWISGSP